MHSLIYRLFAALCLLTHVALLHAQHIAVDVPSTVGQGEPFHLSFIINGDVSGFLAPSMSGLDMLSSRPSVSRSSSYQVINGRSSSSSSTTYTYMVAAVKTGKLTIGPATANVDGRAIQSSAVTINVVKGSVHSGTSVAKVSRNMDLQPAGTPVSAGDLYVTVTPSRTSVFEQEAVLLTYRLYARPKVAVSGIQLMHKPDFSGLVSQEIPAGSIQTTQTSVGGTTYNTATVLQYVVYPQKSGTITIPAVDFVCAVRQGGQYDDPFDAFFSGGGAVDVNVKRSVRPLTLQVKPLPAPKPANFSGGVGRFQMKGEWVTAKPASNDLATYRITISGKGNLKMLAAPTLKMPADFDAYAPKTTEHTKLSDDGMSGSMTYDYTFVPRKKGHYVIPAATFIYYDTEAGRYVTLQTASIPLDVKQGTRSDADVERDARLRSSDIRSIHTAAPGILQNMPTKKWLFTVAYLLLAGIAILVWPLLRKAVLARGDIAGRRSRMAGHVARGRLQHIEKMRGTTSGGAFYDELSHALVQYLSEKFNIPAADITASGVDALLSERGIPAHITALVRDTLQACEYARFAPAADTAAEERLYGLALQAIDGIEQHG